MSLSAWGVKKTTFHKLHFEKTSVNCYKFSLQFQSSTLKPIHCWKKNREMRGPKGSKGLCSIICNWPEGGGGKRSLEVLMDQNCVSEAFAREHCFFLFYRYIQCSLTYKQGELLQVSMLLLIVEKRYWQNFKQIGTGKLFLGENEMCYGIA